MVGMPRFIYAYFASTNMTSSSGLQKNGLTFIRSERSSLVFLQTDFFLATKTTFAQNVKMCGKITRIFEESGGIHGNALLQNDRKHYNACLISSIAAGFSSEEVSPGSRPR